MECNIFRDECFGERYEPLLSSHHVTKGCVNKVETADNIPNPRQVVSFKDLHRIAERRSNEAENRDKKTYEQIFVEVLFVTCDDRWTPKIAKLIEDYYAT